jgi:hypothetical protein
MDTDRLVLAETARMSAEAVLTTAKRYLAARRVSDSPDLETVAAADWRPERFERHFLAVALPQLCRALDEAGLDELLALLPVDEIRKLRNAYEHHDDRGWYIDENLSGHGSTLAGSGRYGFIGTLHVDPVIESVRGISDRSDDLLG